MRSTRRPHSTCRKSILSAAVAGLLVGTPAALAADSTWLNTGTDFNTDGNWSAGVPGAGNQAIFNSAAVTQPNLSSSLSIGKLTFLAGADGYNLTASAGAALTLTASEIIRSDTDSGSNTISAPLILSGGNKTVTTAPGSHLVIAGDISESGGSYKLTIARTAAGAKTVTLSGNNSYSGGTSLTGANGTLTVGSSTALGTGPLILETSDYNIDNSSGAPLTLANGLTFSGVTINYVGSSSMKMTGPITFGGQPGERRFKVLASTLEMAGNITEDANSRPLTKQGAGTLILSGSSNHSGVTTVSEGTLLINGDFSAATGDVIVGSSGTLGGSGKIGGSTTIGGGGKLSPGNSAGVITFNADLTLNNNSTLIFEGGDGIVVGGLLTLNNNWTLSLGEGFQDGGSVTLFTYGELADGADLDPTIVTTNLGFTPSGALSLIDTGSSIVLQGISVVPEPGTMMLALLGFPLIARRTRRQTL